MKRFICLAFLFGLVGPAQAGNSGYFPENVIQNFSGNFLNYYSRIMPQGEFPAVLNEFKCHKADNNLALCATDNISNPILLIGDASEPSTMPLDGKNVKSVVVNANGSAAFSVAMKYALVVELMLKGKPQDVIDGKEPWDKTFYVDGLQTVSAGKAYHKEDPAYTVDIGAFQPGIISIIFAAPSN